MPSRLDFHGGTGFSTPYLAAMRLQICWRSTMFANGATVTCSTGRIFSEVLIFFSSRRSVLDRGHGRAGGGHANLGQCDPDKAITSEDGGQPVFVPVLGSFGAHRHHHEAVFLVGILHTDRDVLGKGEPELRDHL